MPKPPILSALWVPFLLLAAVFLVLAALVPPVYPAMTGPGFLVFGKSSTLFFCMFSSIFSFLALSCLPNVATGRSLTFLTAAVSTLLLGLTAIQLLSTDPVTGANLPALAAAYMMTLRAFGVAVLPPRGDRRGLVEAGWSCALAMFAATVWWILDPAAAVSSFTTVLLLSWPHLIDGINAFADKVFHRAAEASGARSLSSDAFTKIANARDILIEKAALMSGPDLMVTNVMAFNNDPKTLLAVAASAEGQSGHPVAQALRQLATQWHVPLKVPDRFEPAPGLGVIALLGGQTVVIGTTDLLKQLKIDSFTADAIARSLEADGKTVLRVAVGDRVVGVLGLEGTLRQDAGVAGRALRREGLTPLLSSGDNRKTREALAGLLGLELPEDTRPGETSQDAASREFSGAPPLVLSLSRDRRSLELRERAAESGDDHTLERAPIAVSNTDDIGAFPALKALAKRRDHLALQARRLLVGLWVTAGLCGAAMPVPLAVAPILLIVCLGILWTFARFSVADTLRRSSGPS